MGHGLYERLQATHRYYQPCQHPGPEGWAVTDTRPRATCREQPWATSSYVTTAITYWVTRPGGLGVGPTRVVVNGNPRTAPDAYLRLPAPGLRTDGPVRPENRHLAEAKVANWKLLKGAAAHRVRGGEGVDAEQEARAGC